jgi:hypothetical protein
MKTGIYANLLAKIYHKSHRSSKVKNFISELYNKVCEYLEGPVSENLNGIVVYLYNHFYLIRPIRIK